MNWTRLKDRQRRDKQKGRPNRTCKIGKAERCRQSRTGKQKKTARRGLPEKDRQGRDAKIGRLGQDWRTGPPGQDC
jgi:hypothetical protein